MISVKKYVFVITLLVIFILLSFIPYSYGYEENITTKNIATYVEENKKGLIKKLCTDDFCDYMRSVNFKRSVSLYEEKYEAFLAKKIGSQEAYEMKLKGFPITKIIFMGE